jgi:large repetitive protein
VHRWRSAARLAACAVAACVASAAHAAAPPAGSRIDNAAHATFFDTDRGFNTTLASNPVSAVVQAAERLQLDAGRTLVRPPGAIVSLAHTLTNAGNAPASVVLRYANLGGDGHDLAALRLVRDLDGDGVADSGEPVLADGAVLGPLAPGESIALVLEGQVGANAAAGAVARVSLTATTLAQGAAAEVIDSVAVGSGAAVLQLVKSASTLAPQPGDELAFTLTAANPGAVAAAGRSTFIDGAARTLVVLRDAIPANTTFASFGPAGGAHTLVHLAGEPEHHYRSTLPADLRSIDAIAFAWDAPLAPGAALERRFAVRVAANAAGEIVNTAHLHADGVVQASNAMRLALPARAPRLALFTDAAYRDGAAAIDRGAPLYVAFDAARCNADALRAESVTLTLRSRLAEDEEALAAVETAPNSGVFRIEPRVLTQDVGGGRGVPGDGIVGVRANDEITVASPACGGAVVTASVRVDPFGVVFDSKTNAPLAGARVSLVRADGSSAGAPAAVTTGADGAYRLRAVPAGTWHVVVQPPPRYVFPSTLAGDLLPPGRDARSAASHGIDFDVAAQAAPVSVDLPLDAVTQVDLRVGKHAARSTVEIGDTVDYRVEVGNVSGQLLGRVVVHDRLPAGFAYQRGSARLEGRARRHDGSALPEPDGGAGPALAFHVGSIEHGATLVLHYRARVGLGARPGDAVNRAYAVSDGALDKQSNSARATVKVLPGVFDARGVVLGNVWADCNRNGAIDDGEPGVPGVRIWLEDGTHATTDGQGRWSLYGLRAVTHVAKLDATTLPAGARLLRLDHRQAGDAGSRFVDMKDGQLQRADFALDGCTTALHAAIRVRADALAGSDDEAGLARAAQAATLPAAPTQDARAAPAAGTVGVRAGAAIGDAVAPLPLPLPSAAADAPWDLARIAALDARHGIVNLREGQVLPRTQTAVLLQGPIDAVLGLAVDGVIVPSAQIGRRIERREHGLQVVEYVGVGLRPGRNRLALTGAGRPIETSVIAPGALARLRLSVADAASARAPRSITLETLDANGVAVTARTPLTLDATAGRWLASDLDAQAPGVQVFAEGGNAVFAFEPPEAAGEVQLHAASGDVRAEATFVVGPALRPMLAAGLVEGTLSLRKLDPRHMQPAGAHGGFEQELRVAADALDGRAQAGARAALFLKGTVRGDTLLTLAYDSDKPTRERLFRDIQPDEHYPIYGDSAAKGFDAQSTGRLYLKLERERSFVLYGDFNTEPATPGSARSDERRLGRYQRALNGAQWHAEGDAGSVSGFASRTTSRQQADELPGRGTSGPYLLSRAPAIENSERVEVVTRARDAAGRILRVRTLQRFVDYRFDAAAGSVLLAAPLASLDEDFNPQSLRITYESEREGDAAWVRGVSVQGAIGAHVTAGAGWVRDDDPLSPLTLASASLTARPVSAGSAAVPTSAVFEVARSATPLGDQADGVAARTELRHDEGALQWQVQAVKAGAGFVNPSAGVTPGREEVNAKVALSFGAATKLESEAQYAADRIGGAARAAARVGVSQRLSEGLRGELALQASRFDVGSTTAASSAVPLDDDTHHSVIGRIVAVPAAWPRVSVSVELEQDLDDGARHAARLGAEYRLADGGRLYARHDLANSLATLPSLDAAAQRHATVIGVATEIARDAQWTSEYRIRDAIDGRSAEAAVGLRNRWRLGAGWRVGTSVERVRVFGGTEEGESVAAAGALEYTGAPDWKGAARLEWRDGRALDTQLASVGAARRLNEEWTVLGKAQFTRSEAAADAGRTQHREQIGLAWREAGQRRTDALLRLEDVHERTGADEAAATPAQRRHSTIVSGHVHHQPQPGRQLMGRWAARVSRDARDGVASREHAQLVGARITQDLDTDWDVGLQAALWQGSGGTRRLGLGTEVGRQLAKNFWLSAGWNWLGFADRELAGTEPTQRGLYLRVRFKFDENLWEGAP